MSVLVKFCNWIGSVEEERRVCVVVVIGVKYHYLVG